MALRFLGKDPDSAQGQSPTVYFDDERNTFVVQGWEVTDSARLAQLDLPEHETVVEIPARMLPFFKEVTGGAGPVA